MPKAAKMDQIKLQKRFLDAVRNTGSLNQAYKASGVCEATVRRYRDQHPEFDEAVQSAKQYYRIQREIKFSPDTIEEGFKLIRQRIKDGTISDAILFKICFDRQNSVLL